MAFRFQLLPQPVGVLSTCSAAVRERLLSELGGVFSGPLLELEHSSAGSQSFGMCVLPSGFQVRYAVDWRHGVLHLAELSGPEGGLSASAP